EDEYPEVEYVGSAEPVTDETSSVFDDYAENDEATDPWFTDDSETDEADLDSPLVAGSVAAPVAVATQSIPRRAAVPPLPNRPKNVFIPPTDDEVIVDRVNHVADLLGATMSPA